MDPKRHRKVGELFDAVIDLEGEARLQYLDTACRGDPSLRAEVESLLEHHHERTLIPQVDIPSSASVSLRPLASNSRSNSGSSSSFRRWWLLGSRPIASIAPRCLLATIIGLTLILALLGWWVHRGIERTLRHSLEKQLRTVLEVDVAALKNWIAFEDARVESWARNDKVRHAIGQLVHISEQPGASREDLLDPDLDPNPQTELHQLFQLVTSPQTSLGFSVVSRTGKMLADDDDKALAGDYDKTMADNDSKQEIVGKELALEVGQYLRRVLLGETVLSKPKPKGALIVDIEPDHKNLRMFVAAPVINDKRERIAALGLTFPANEKFTQLLSLAQLGKTGETYAFDSQGDVLSELRDIKSVRAAGLLGADVGNHTALKVKVCDPGGNLMAGYQPDRPCDSWPLTKMAALAAAGHHGCDMGGYRNYLGVRVLGAWRWLPKYDFGIATEITVEEAYAPLRYVRLAFGSLLGLLSLLFGIVLATSFAYLRLKREVGEASQLGNYTLEELIGQGGMGKVYKAHHAMLRRPTAVKILDGMEADRETVLRFEREVQLTSELTHPNTIQIYDYGRTRDEIFYYVMEYLPGLNLRELVAVSGALPAGRAIHLLRQVCGALVEAHERGLIHRDIKPANIMVCDRGGVFDVVKVLDFGLARSSQPDGPLRITSPQSLGGTPQFIAPERIRNPSILDPRSDVFSLGAVAFFLLAGRKVYTGKSTADLFYQVMNVVPERLGSIAEVDVPPELDELVATCLAKDLEDRPQSMVAIMGRLDKLSEGLPWSQEDARRSWAKVIVQHPTGITRQTDVRLAR